MIRAVPRYPKFFQKLNWTTDSSLTAFSAPVNTHFFNQTDSIIIVPTVLVHTSTLFLPDLDDHAVLESAAANISSVKFFSKLRYLFFGYFDPVNIFYDNKNAIFSG